MAIMNTPSSSSTGKSATSGSSSSSAPLSLPDEEAPPMYTSPNPPAFTPDHINDLNPEASKKLAREARESNRDVFDYGFVGILPPTDGLAGKRVSYEMDSEGNIVSHDPVLSTSPKELLAFLNLHLSSPPGLLVTMRGTHLERQSIINHCSNPGQNGSIIQPSTNLRENNSAQTREVEVEDFSFTIDALDVVEKGLGKAIGGGGMRGLLYNTGGWECCYRGGGGGRKRELLPGEEERVRDGCARCIGRRRRIKLEDEETVGVNMGAGETEVGDGKKWRTVKFMERRKMDREKRERDRQGLPQFVHPASLVEFTSPSSNPDHPPLLLDGTFVDLVENHSSIPIGLSPMAHAVNPSSSLIHERESRLTSVRRTIADYCSSKKVLKEFKVTKEVYGWDWRLLEASLRETIHSTRYTGKVSIGFKIAPQTLIIRPENNFSKIFSLHVLWKILLWVVLVYPVLLLIELIAGDRFDSVRVSFPLSRWRRLPIPREDGPSSSTGISPTTALSLAKPLSARDVPKVTEDGEGGYLYLVGTQEGEWLRRWEDAIKEGVREGKRGGTLKAEVERRQDERGIREGLRGYRD